MLDRACDQWPVKLFDFGQAIQHEELGPLDMIWRERRVGGAPRQRDLSAAGVDDQAVGPVSLQDPADISDVVGKAGDDEIRIFERRRIDQQRAPLEDVVAGQGDEHRMLDIVEERVAVADAFQRELRRERNDLRQARMRAPEPILHVGGKERA